MISVRIRGLRRGRHSPTEPEVLASSNQTLADPLADAIKIFAKYWSEWQDLNLRPPRPERGALPIRYFSPRRRRIELLRRAGVLATDLAAARKAWPKNLDPPVLVAAWWCFDLRTAQQVVTLASASDLRQAKRAGSRFTVTPSEATVAITAAAGRLHFRLTDHTAVLARAKAAGVELDSKLIAAQDAGQLREFNREYRRRRLAAKM